ncbi:hypothetical protein TrispH2_010190 [Trichoplax sp. H2]|nr:hypothetical protein TrispH2_010190 [Trichoplax sp. H2]|eukprot:RDD38976.1 hypothetical protein TrispH2_010190 [Trichoplax sp. H2]
MKAIERSEKGQSLATELQDEIRMAECFYTDNARLRDAKGNGTEHFIIKLGKSDIFTASLNLLFLCRTSGYMTEQHRDDCDQGLTIEFKDLLKPLNRAMARVTKFVANLRGKLYSGIIDCSIPLTKITAFLLKLSQSAIMEQNYANGNLQRMIGNPREVFMELKMQFSLRLKSCC